MKSEIVRLRDLLIELEGHADERIRRAATYWLAGLGGLTKIITGAGAGNTNVELVAQVAELFTVGLDLGLAALEDEMLEAANAVRTPGIPHLGVGKAKSERTLEAVGLVGMLRDQLRGEGDPERLRRAAEQLQARGA